ncbi:unnamed protein product [Calypogeia fissa]
MNIIAIDEATASVTDPVTVLLGNDSAAPDEMEPIVSYSRVENSGSKPTEEQTSVETVSLENVACQTHHGSRCDGCGRNPIVGPLFRSCKILGYNLCVQCFETTDAERSEYTMIDLFYFEQRTSVDRVTPASSYGENQADSTETRGGNVQQQQTHEAPLSMEKGFVAKMGELALKENKRTEEMLKRPSEEGWDLIVGELQELGFYD